MREILDCAVLLVAGHQPALPCWFAQCDGKLGRVRLHSHRLDTACSSPCLPDVNLLARAALQLKRYDVCVLPVESATLPWARTALACSRSLLRTPLLGVVRDLRAAAVQDLLALGMTDFIREPACPEEMRARLTRLAETSRAVAALPATSSCVAEPSEPYASGAMAGPRGFQNPADLALTCIQQSGHAPLHEPFRKAKARVVEGFEREYLHSALARYGGNVAQAARASSKHRRAFWALMRKHHIDAAPYRTWTDAAQADSA